MTSSIQTIEATWLGVAPPGFGDNVHALVQSEHRDDDGEIAIHFPALVYTSTGVSAEERLPDGRLSNKTVETFQLDFRAKTYPEARALAAAYREAIGRQARSWDVLQDDYGVEVVLTTIGEIVPRRVVEISMLYTGE